MNRNEAFGTRSGAQVARGAADKIPGSVARRTAGRVRDPVRGARLRAAIYTRFSSAAQNESSTARQVDVATLYCERTGFDLVTVLSDEARSGARIAGREALHELIEMARSGKIGAVVIESADRLSRDLVDMAWLHRTLADLGVELHATDRGRLQTADIAIYGLLSQEQRETMLRRSKWGREKLAADGRCPHGPSYGYRAVPGKPGELRINEKEAEVIRQIFDAFLDGLSPEHIAVALNQAGHPAPRGIRWTGAAVRVQLRQPKFAGFLYYGRTESVRERETGKKKILPVPSDQWIAVEVKRWRIVPYEQWRAAQDLLEARSTAPRRARRQANHCLSQLVTCGVCGASMGSRYSYFTPRMMCTNAGFGGGCTNKRQVLAHHLERQVGEVILSYIDRPEFAEVYVASHNRQRELALKATETRRQTLEREVQKYQHQLRSSFEEALTDGMTERSLKTVREAIEADLSEAERTLAELPRVSPPARLDDQKIGTLRSALSGLSMTRPFRPETESGFRFVAAFRALVREVVFIPEPDGGYRLLVRGHFADLVLGAGTDSGDVGLEYRCEAMPARERFGLDRGLEARRLATEGRYAISGALWEKLLPSLPPKLQNRDGLRVDAPRTIEAMLVKARTRAPWPRMELAGWAHPETLRAASRFVYSGVWNAALAALEEISPRHLEGVDRAIFDPLLPRKPRGRGTRRATRRTPKRADPREAEHAPVG